MILNVIQIVNKIPQSLQIFQDIVQFKFIQTKPYLIQKCHFKMKMTSM